MDKKTIAVIAVIVILVAAIGVGLFLTRGKNTKPADTKIIKNTSNTSVTNTTSQNVASNSTPSNAYNIDEDGEREYYYDDYYDNDGPYD